MNTAKASLQGYRQSPRKVRVVANLVKGKNVADAINILMFTGKRASEPLKKLLQSAVANAKNLDLDTNNLFVKEMTVNGGQILHRRRPMSRGRAFAIKKRTSHVSVLLEEKGGREMKEVSKKEDVSVKAEKVTAKKPAVKKATKTKAVKTK